MPEKIYKSVKIHRMQEKFQIAVPQTEHVIEAPLEEDGIALEQEREMHLQEIEQLKQEKTAIIDSIHDRREALKEEEKKIIELAEINAFKSVKSANEERKKMMKIAQEERNRLLEKASHEAKEIVSQAKLEKDAIKKQAYDKGYEEGSHKAYESYRPEVEKMLHKLTGILKEVINKRNDIIESSEQQLSDIAIEVARQVIKGISESDKTVVIRNVTEALRRIKGRTRISIRVNISDLELLSKHKDDFYQKLDNIEHISILEDPNVERGGCVIETDFGEIDAKISSQLNEIESAIKKVQPIRGL